MAQELVTHYQQAARTPESEYMPASDESLYEAAKLRAAVLRDPEVTRTMEWCASEPREKWGEGEYHKNVAEALADRSRQVLNDAMDMLNSDVSDPVVARRIEVLAAIGRLFDSASRTIQETGSVARVMETYHKYLAEATTVRHPYDELSGQATNPAELEPILAQVNDLVICDSKMRDGSFPGVIHGIVTIAVDNIPGESEAAPLLLEQETVAHPEIPMVLEPHVAKAETTSTLPASKALNKVSVTSDPDVPSFVIARRGGDAVKADACGQVDLRKRDVKTKTAEADVATDNQFEAVGSTGDGQDKVIDRLKYEIRKRQAIIAQYQQNDHGTGKLGFSI